MKAPQKALNKWFRILGLKGWAIQIFEFPPEEFNIAAAALTYGVYDFDSVMHYGRTAFSRNVSDTITVLAPFTAQWQNAIGQRTHLSQADKNAMGCNYPLAIWRWVSTTPQATQAGDCFMPYGGFTTAFARIQNHVFHTERNFTVSTNFNRYLKCSTPNTATLNFHHWSDVFQRFFPYFQWSFFVVFHSVLNNIHCFVENTISNTFFTAVHQVIYKPCNHHIVELWIR